MLTFKLSFYLLLNVYFVYCIMFIVCYSSGLCISLYKNKYAIYLLNIEISPGKLEISRENFSGGKGKYQGKNLNQLTGSRLRKEYNRAACCRPVCLSYTLSTS